MGKQLTVRQTKFVAGVVEGKTQTEAARDAGYAHPHVQGSTVLKRPHVKEALESALEAEGLSAGYIAGKIKELCEASNTEEDGKETPNWTARGRGLDLLVRVTGADKHPAELAGQFTVEEWIFRMHELEFGPEASDEFGQLKVKDGGNGRQVIEVR